jgi:hypothetical protein
MAGNTTLDSSPGIILRAHQYIQNIETGHFGYYYSKSLENLNYIVVDCIAKPAIDKAPEWTYNNRVVDSIKTHRTLSLTIAGTIAVILFICVVYFAHPKRADTQPKIPEKDPNAEGTPETSPSGPEGTKKGEPTPDTNGKKPKDAEDVSKANGAGHERKPDELNGEASGKPEQKDDKKAEGSPEKPKEDST